jgi:hypothetical protein
MEALGISRMTITTVSRHEYFAHGILNFAFRDFVINLFSLTG